MAYLMRSSDDCGPACLEAVLGMAYETILSAWPGGWRGGDRGRLGMPNDTPFDHLALLEFLNEPWRFLSAEDILAGEGAPDRTVILLHNQAHPILQQHWVVLAGMDAQLVRVHWGDGTVRHLTHDQFRRDWQGSLPWWGGLGQCAYEVRGPKCATTRLTWWKKTLAYLTGKFI